MKQTLALLCACIAAICFNGCCPKTEPIVLPCVKPTIPPVNYPDINISCASNDMLTSTKCALINYEKMKAYALELQAIVDELR